MKRSFLSFCLQVSSLKLCLDVCCKYSRFKCGNFPGLQTIIHADCLQVLKHHGLVPIPVDLYVPLLGPRLDLLAQFLDMLAPHVSCILVAHIYGRRFETEGIAALAASHKVDWIEDIAEAFRGFDFVGHPEASLAFFSFGAIKAATSLGGAVARVRDREVFERMEQIHLGYPSQDRATYGKKIVAGVAAGFLLEWNWGMKLCRRIDFDPKPHVVSMLRGFSGDLVPRLRHQPSTPLLHMLASRMENFDQGDYITAVTKPELFCKLLPPNVFTPGRYLPDEFRHHWLFPMVIDFPDKCEDVLKRHGVLCYRGATQLNLVPQPNSDDLHPAHREMKLPPPEHAKLLLDHTIYMPIHKRTTISALHTIAALVNKLAPQFTLSPSPLASIMKPSPDVQWTTRSQNSLQLRSSL
jgi:perosamine synthetase